MNLQGVGAAFPSIMVNDMSSYDYGKYDVCEWIRDNIPKTASVLDVGACDGKWRRLLPEYSDMDAVEVYYENYCRVQKSYREAFYKDIRDFRYDFYNLVIFGDVIEHLSVEQAQKVLEYAKHHAEYVLVSVPFLYKQGMSYGNPYEIHFQDDLTPELFIERYPDFEVLCRAADDYCYYIYHNEQS